MFNLGVNVKTLNVQCHADIKFNNKIYKWCLFYRIKTYFNSNEFGFNSIGFLRF